MKKTLLYIAVLALGAISLSSCEDELAKPTIEDYLSQLEAEAAAPESNSTLLEVKKAFYQNEFSYATQIGKKENGEDYVVRCRINSSTAAGNIYKQLCAFDETGGMIFSINSSKLEDNGYTAGREIVVNLTGMYIGAYGNGMQIGSAPFDSNAYPGRMEPTIWDDACSKVGLVNTAAIDTVEITVAELKKLSATADLDKWLSLQGMLIRVNNVAFNAPGSALGVKDQSNNTSTVSDADGNTLDINTSGYSTLYAIEAPDGRGDVVGILSWYNKSWQLKLIDEKGLINFKPLPTVAYTMITALETGKPYLMAANGKIATTLAGDYGYLKVADAKKAEGKTIETDNESYWTFETSEDGYYIKDASGRYLYLTGTYNSFNASATLPAEGAQWTVTVEDSGEVIINNIDMNKSIQYDSKYDSYGAYPDVRGTYPSLYAR